MADKDVKVTEAVRDEDAALVAGTAAATHRAERFRNVLYSRIQPA